MNKWVGMGRLTRDPEVRYSQGKKTMAIARYTLAVNRKFKQDEADFITCVAFDKSGEFAEKYFRQGIRVLVSGRIQTGSYTNKDGVKVYTTEVIIEEQEFADSKNAGGNTEPRPNPSTQADIDGFMNIPDNMADEGLPFN